MQVMELCRPLTKYKCNYVEAGGGVKGQCHQKMDILLYKVVINALPLKKQKQKQKQKILTPSLPNMKNTISAF